MKNILFDLDGTLTDPKLGIVRCITFALEKMEKDVPTNLNWCIGPPLKESFSRILETQEDSVIKQALKLYRERFKAKGMFENQVYSGINELLKTLKDKGCRLYVATSKPYIFAREIVEYFKIDHYFNEIYGSNLDGSFGDKTDLIKNILRCECLNTVETVMIGDREHDIIGARKSGILSIGVLWGYGSIEELSSQNPNWIVADTNRLVECLARIYKQPITP